MQAHGPPLPAARQARESMRRPSRRQRTRCGQSGAHPIESAACPLRRDGRVVECAGLEIRYTVIPYRGFESLSLRHYKLQRHSLCISINPSRPRVWRDFSLLLADFAIHRCAHFWPFTLVFPLSFSAPCGRANGQVARIKLCPVFENLPPSYPARIFIRNLNLG